MKILQGLWTLLNSRKFAVYLLVAMTMLLVASSFIPSFITLGQEGWYRLSEESPALFWFASHFSTPFLVTHPVFIVVSVFLFLSTCACTITRVLRWYERREVEFSKDRAFSFSKEERSAEDSETLRGKIDGVLRKGRWDRAVQSEEGLIVVSGQKGMSGFWGSIVFHIGLLICFFAGPVSALTTFRGEFLIPEGLDVRLREGFASFEGKAPSVLPDATLSVRDFRARYYEGRFKYDFGGTVVIEDADGIRELPFAVNEPVSYRGYQLTLHEYGFSPRVALEQNGEDIFDYYLNLRHPESGDVFDLPGESLRAVVFFFPDFVSEGGKFGTKSQVPENPVVLVRLFRGDSEVFESLLEPGQQKTFGEFEVRVPDYRFWVNFIVVRESGVTVVMVGSVIGLSGLFFRFLSNERRIEFLLTPSQGGTGVLIRGYSRYYPAFLEREVQGMADRIAGGHRVAL